MTIFLLDRVNCADSAYFITETFKPLIDENDNNVNIRLKFLRAEFANTKWSPSGHQVVTKWSPSGLQVVTKWSPSGLQVVTKWSPSGHQVVTKWSPSGHQVITK